MSTTTSFAAVPKPQSGDPVSDGDDIMRAMADRLDYLFGESGDDTITPSAANTKTTKVINFGRTYKTPPRVVVCPGKDGSVSNFSSTVTLTIWVDDVTTTGFTVAINASNTSSRDFTWIAKPKRTDVTP